MPFLTYSESGLSNFAKLDADDVPPIIPLPFIDNPKRLRDPFSTFGLEISIVTSFPKIFLIILVPEITSFLPFPFSSAEP